MNSNVERIRIVDKQGNPVRINKAIPKFNEEQMNKQKDALKNAKTENIEVNKFRQDFNNKSVNVETDTNIIVPVSTKYPDDIFADRITNYNYIQKTKVKSTNPEATIPANKIVESNADIITEDDIIKNNKSKKQNTAYILTEANNKAEASNMQSKQTKNSNTTSKTNAIIDTNTDIKNGYYIQIGIYSEKKNADSAYNKYSKISNTIINEQVIKNKRQYTVLMGPYSDKKIAEKDMEKIIKTGHYDIYITEKK